MNVAATIVALAVLSALTLTAVQPVTPMPADLDAALEFAQNAWQHKISTKVSLLLEPMNACRLNGKDELAITTVITTTSTMIVDTVRQPTTTSFSYVIKVNSNCRWSREWLNQVVTHEYGHLLIGTSYHSRNKRSIMFPITMPSGQSVMKEDMDRASSVNGF